MAVRYRLNHAKSDGSLCQRGRHGYLAGWSVQGVVLVGDFAALGGQLLYPDALNGYQWRESFELILFGPIEILFGQNGYKRAAALNHWIIRAQVAPETQAGYTHYDAAPPEH